MKNFLEEFGKSNTGWGYSSGDGPPSFPHVNSINCINRNNFYTLSGFFFNLNKLNNDKILKENEYIIGISGFIETYEWDNTHKVYGNIPKYNLILISNIINIYELKGHTQSKREGEIMKNYNEIYKLELIEENNYLIDDLLINLISRSFNEIYIYFNCHSNHGGHSRGYHLSTNQFTTNYELLKNDNSKNMIEFVKYISILNNESNESKKDKEILSLKNEINNLCESRLSWYNINIENEKKIKDNLNEIELFKNKYEDLNKKYKILQEEYSHTLDKYTKLKNVIIDKTKN
tara:strand:- start:91 stop:960 length:870 start_codon:yes stop_codon:yes gene_type:complete